MWYDFLYLWYNVHSDGNSTAVQHIALLLDGNSEHVAPAWRKKFVTALGLIKCLN